MDIARFFTRKEKIGGLEISQSNLRFALFGLSRSRPRRENALPRGREISLQGLAEKKKKKILILKSFEEINLPEGIISNGKLENFSALVLVLKELKKKIRLSRISLIILSLPPSNTYTQVFEFPERLTSEQLKESMQIVIEYSLPLSSDEIFLDWEEISSTKEEKREVLLSLGKKSEILPYLKALSEAGFTSLATETHPLSLSRVLKLPKEKPIYLAILSEQGLNSTVLEKGSLRLSRFIFWNEHFLSKGKKEIDFETIKKIVADETQRTINFYQAEPGQIEKVESIQLVGPLFLIETLEEYLFEELKIPTKKAELLPSLPQPEIAKKDNRSFTALGAALRGLIPRAKDTHISLMPVGTEEAYEQKRALSFVDFVSHGVIFISLFFVLTFSGVFGLISLVGQSIEEELFRQSQMPFPTELVKLEETAREFNKDIATLISLEKEIPRWSEILIEIEGRKIPGITLANLRITSPADLIFLEGKAGKREELLAFRDNLAASEYFKEVTLPLKFLEKKENIDFTINFKLKDSAIIFAQ